MAGSIINHFGQVTLRVNGSGSLLLSLKSLDDVYTQTLQPVTMQTLPGKEPTKLCNLTVQRARLRFETTAIDEYLKINKIIIWIRPTASQFPM